MIALIQMQRFLQRQAKKSDDPSCNYRTEALNLDEDDDKNGSGLCKAKSLPESDELEMIPEPEVSATSSEAFHRRRLAAGTLVVCPASVLRQWARELDEKVADESKLSVLVYHGGNRTRDPAELAKYDVVVTTYSIVTNEVPKQPLVDEEDSDQKNGEKHGLSLEFSTMNKKPKKMSMPSANKRGKKKGKKDNDSSSYDFDCGPLARVSWFRVILDEAQTIKNHRTQVARACCGLRAKRRWCLSGTPIQNAVDDLYSYFRFLRYDPYADYKTFCNTIKIPISRNSVHGYKKLQAVLRAIMLRRTKGDFSLFPLFNTVLFSLSVMPIRAMSVGIYWCPIVNSFCFVTLSRPEKIVWKFCIFSSWFFDPRFLVFFTGFLQFYSPINRTCLNSWLEPVNKSSKAFHGHFWLCF